MYEHLDLIVVNQSECELLTGIYPSDEESCMEALLSFEARGVDALITLGTHGSMCNAFGRYLFVPAQRWKPLTLQEPEIPLSELSAAACQGMWI